MAEDRFQTLLARYATGAPAARLLELDEAGAAQALALALVPNAAMRQTRAGELSIRSGS